MKISCAFPTTMSSHEDIRIAEEKVAIDDIDALRRLYTLLGMQEQLRG